MFSYNAFMFDLENGWHKGSANNIFLTQNPQGKEWGATQRGMSTDEYVQESENIVASSWDFLKQQLPTLDTLFIYVGSYGAEKAIELAKESSFLSEKLTFVMCDCTLKVKQQKIADCGYQAARVIMCDCGGQREMNSIFRRYISEGL